MNKQKFRTIASYILPSMITFIIVMGVFLVKGIFPFGSNRIDYYDMGQTNAPLYYHLYDFLHGKVSLFFDWYINEGQNLSMGSAIQWNISPFNLFFLLVPRNLILESLSLFTLLRLVFMAFTMYCFLHHVRKVPYFWEVLFSVGYSLCGYAMTHYTIPTYLDTAVFVPLLMWGLYSLLKEGKMLFYTLMLGFTVALSYYLGFMNLIFILMVSGLYLLLVLPKEQRGDRAWKLGTGTIGGICLSCVTLIPAATQMLGSTRFNSNLSGGLTETLVSILNSIGADMYYMKWWLLYGMALPGVLILIGLWMYRKEWKKNLFVVLFVFVPAALIPVESINILWHFGTYYHYPVRCGYLIPFAILTVAAYYAEKLHRDYNKEESYVNRKAPQWVLPFVGGAVAIGAAVLVLSKYMAHEKWYVKDLFPVTVIVFGIMCLLYAILFLWRGKQNYHLAACLLLFELVAGAFVSYGVPHYYTDYDGDPEQSGEYVITANQLRESLPIEESFLNRIKNPDTELNTNYSMILNRATITGWANTVSSAQQNAAIAFGYGAHFMRILDSGGTFFTDSLLNVKDILAATPIDTATGVYEAVSQAGDFTLYRNLMALPFGMTVSSELTDFDVYESSLAEIQNAFYQALSDDTENIAAEIPHEKGQKEITVPITGHQAVYMQGGSFDEIRVNGETVKIPSISELDNTAYPAWFNSNVVCLGCFQDENIEIEVIGESVPKLTTLNLDKLQSLSEQYQNYSVQGQAGKRSLKITVQGTDEKNMVLLPMNFDEGWDITVNGKKTTEAARVAGLFTGILLQPGTNEISMKYTPPGLKIGILMTLVSGLLVLGVFLIYRKKQIRLPEVLGKTAGVIFQAVWWVCAVGLYVIPVLWLVVHVVVKRL